MLDELQPGAIACLRLADVDNSDHVLIVSDDARIADALVGTIRQFPSSNHAMIDVFYISPDCHPLSEMPKGLASAFTSATVIFNVLTAFGFGGHWFSREPRLRQQLVEVRHSAQRIYHMIGVTRETFRGTGALALLMSSPRWTT